MTPLAFLRTEDVQRLLERAARAAGTPLAIHQVENGEERLRSCSWGDCAACKYVSGRPGGRDECQNSRLGPSSTALRQERPIPFVCHMGFGCISVPAYRGESYVLTFGPYIAAEEAQALEGGAKKGLSALTKVHVSDLPFRTDDIHRAPQKAIPAVAEWVFEALDALWKQHNAAEAISESPEATAAQEERRKKLSKKGASLEVDAYQASSMALLLADGNVSDVRDVLRSQLGEAHLGVRPKPAVRRARVLATLFAALEASERAKLDTARAWIALPDMLDAIRDVQTDQELLDSAMKVLGLIARAAKAAAASVQGRASDESLNALLMAHLEEGIELAEVAERLGEKPPTISKRLKRNFGLSFSEYLGRLRIDKAKEMLRRTKLSATEIAHRVGIRDQSHFSKLFKKFEGTTPSEYRERYGKHR